MRQVNTHPRPSNHTKIYGSGYKSFGTGGPEDGVERFWRNILGGSASARFHRPDSGNGLNDFAKGSIKAARILESLIKFWDITPQMGLLSDRESNEAYLAAKPGESYALYFTNGGSVGLDLSGATGSFDVTWISVSMGITHSDVGRWRLSPDEKDHPGRRCRNDLRAVQGRLGCRDREEVDQLADLTLDRDGRMKSGRLYHLEATLVAAVMIAAGVVTSCQAGNDEDRIQPYAKNRFYWQYRGKPVLLLGGSDDDDLFQWAGKKLTLQLDLLKSVGGNYVRNTMSDRDEGGEWGPAPEGVEVVYAFRKVDDRYDLNQWNEEYWRKFDNFLQTHIRSARMLTDAMNVFRCEPHNDLLSQRGDNEQNYIEGYGNGIRLKVGPVALLRNNTIADCQTGVLAYTGRRREFVNNLC